MKITRIAGQVKQQHRYSIYVDGSYSFSLSESALVTSGLVSGQELSLDEVNAYKQLSADDKQYNRALRYVAMRPRSRGEMSDYLARKEVAPDLIANILMRLTDLGLLDDAAYARSFVHDRLLLRPTSRRRLTLELRRRKVDSQYIDAAFADAELSETDSLRELIIKKRRQTKYQNDEKLMQFLARQGYGYGDIKRALEADD